MPRTTYYTLVVRHVQWLAPKRVAALAAAGLAVASASVVIRLVVLRGGGSLAAPEKTDLARVAPQSLQARFALLSASHTNRCGLRPEALDSIAVNGRLQGSCCSPMVYDHYVSQIRGLRRYATVSQIPADPYDISVALARRLLAYDGQVELLPSQQQTYRRAMQLADEHGPCCCHCWRWSAFEGQARFLISRRHYTAVQIAQIWDLEHGCGGPGR